MIITTLNALIEALQDEYPVNKVFISNGKRDKKIETIIGLCRSNRVIYQMVPGQTITRKAGPDHQGIFAEVAPVKFYTLDEVLADGKTGLLLILDSINDTGNLGAIIRSAVAAGVDGIIISQRNTAPVNETVLKTSAGSLLKARIVQSQNLRNVIDTLKKREYWVIAAEKEGRIPYYEYDFNYKTAIVMGSESKGVSPLLKKTADERVFIPQSGDIESLNVSAAAAVILFEALRQKKLYI